MPSIATNQLQPSEIVDAFLTDAPIRVDQLVVALGLQLSYAVLGDVSGKIERAGKTYKITVNGTDPRVRQRFTVAHEIGHYVLHRDLIGDGIVDDAMYRSKLSDTYETQANQYAAYILMPPNLFRSKYREGVRSYPDLARAFEVSSQAAEYRAKNLGLI